MRVRYGDPDLARRLLGVRSLARKDGPTTVEEAGAALLDLGFSDDRPLRRYLERRSAAPLSLAQVASRVRQLTDDRDLIRERTEGQAREHK